MPWPARANQPDRPVNFGREQTCFSTVMQRACQPPGNAENLLKPHRSLQNPRRFLRTLHRTGRRRQSNAINHKWTRLATPE
jgi:hypothetical protein